MRKTRHLPVAGLLLLALASSIWAAPPKKKPPPKEATPPADEYTPYEDEEKIDERNRRELPKRSEPTPIIRDETDFEKKKREETLAHLDDPNYGVSAEFVFGVMLLESSRGVGVEARPQLGARLVWEFARLIPDEYWREAMFVDFGWRSTSYREGNNTAFVDTVHHSITAAPAFAFPLGPKSSFAPYVQAGVGVGIQSSRVSVDKNVTDITGSKLLLQYGVGFRGRPAITADGAVRMSFRIELMRFRRGYMDDTFFGGSLGAVF
jgi:hypothetical protein